MINMSNIFIEDFKDCFNTLFVSLLKDGYIMTNPEYKISSVLPDDYVYSSKNRGEKGMSFYKVLFKKKRKVIAELSFTVIYDMPGKTISAYGVKVNVKDPSDKQNFRYLDKTNSLEYTAPYINVAYISLEDFVTEIMAFMINCIMYTEYYLLHEYSIDPTRRWILENGVDIDNDKNNIEGFVKFLLS